MDTEIMKKLGFNEKEIKVYIALLMLGTVTASRISKETNIDRATSYRYIDSLIHKGAVSYIIKNNIRYFTAAHPEKILSDLAEKKAEYEKILPDLVSLTKIPKDETIAEVYRGEEGIKTVLRSILRTKEEHYVLGDQGHFQDMLPIFFQQFINSCLNNRIKERILCSQKVKYKIQQFDYKYSETRSLPNDILLPATTLIYGNKIVLFDWTYPYSSIVIKNKNMASSYKNYFNLLWKVSKK